MYDDRMFGIMSGFYGFNRRLSKSTVKSLSVILLAFSFSAGAVDRISYVSVSTMFPYELKPEHQYTDITQSVQFAVFFENTFASVFGWDLGVTDSHRMGFTAGLQWYLNDSNRIDPYLTAKFLYKLSDANKFGWRTTVGAEWNARPISNMDNLRFFVESGASFVFDTPQQLWFELIHVGGSWHF